MFFRSIAELEIQIPHLKDTARAKQDREESMWDTVGLGFKEA